jgi:hypothetical protein
MQKLAYCYRHFEARTHLKTIASYGYSKLQVIRIACALCVSNIKGCKKKKGMPPHIYSFKGFMTPYFRMLSNFSLKASTAFVNANSSLSFIKSIF